MVRNNKFSSELVKPLIVKIHFRYMNTISVWLGSLDWNQEHRPNNRRSRCLTTTKTLALMLQSWKPIIRCASLSINRLAYKQLWNYNNASCITRPTHQLQLETVCIYPSSTIFFCLCLRSRHTRADSGTMRSIKAINWTQRPILTKFMWLVAAETQEI